MEPPGSLATVARKLNYRHNLMHPICSIKGGARLQNIKPLCRHVLKENSSKIKTDVCFPAKEKTMNSFISPSPLLKHVYLQINIRNHLYTSS